MVVLDTDHLSVLEWETDSPAGKLLARLSQLDPDEAVTTIINFEEQMRGWLAYLARVRTLAQQLEAYRRLQRHLDNYRTIPTLEFDSRAAAEFQRLRRSFRRIGTMDLKVECDFRALAKKRKRLIARIQPAAIVGCATSK